MRHSIHSSAPELITRPNTTHSTTSSSHNQPSPQQKPPYALKSAPLPHTSSTAQTAKSSDKPAKSRPSKPAATSTPDGSPGAPAPAPAPAPMQHPRRNQQSDPKTAARRSTVERDCARVRCVSGKRRSSIAWRGWSWRWCKRSGNCVCDCRRHEEEVGVLEKEKVTLNLRHICNRLSNVLGNTQWMGDSFENALVRRAPE